MRIYVELMMQPDEEKQCDIVPVELDWEDLMYAAAKKAGLEDEEVYAYHKMTMDLD